MMCVELISCRSQRPQMLTPKSTKHMLEEALSLFVLDMQGLHNAIRNNNLTYIKRYIKAGKDVNVAIESKAVRNNTLDRAQKYSNANYSGTGKDIDATASPASSSALHIAAECGNLDSIDTLLQAGANLHLIDANGQSAIGIAINAGRSDVVNFLLHQGANVNAMCDGTHTPLTLATTLSLDMVRMLIAEGADVNTRDAKGISALTWAARQNCIERVRLLVEHGANVNDGKVGSYALQATAHDHNDTVAVACCLAEHGARYEPDGNAALSHAVHKDSAELIRLFVQQGADAKEPQVSIISHLNSVALEPPEVSKTSLLIEALCGDNWNAAKVLIESGADVNDRDETGTVTALGRAVQGNCVAVVEALLERGANPNVTPVVFQGRRQG